MTPKNHLSPDRIYRLLAASLVLLGLSGPAANAQVQFSGPTNYPVGTAPAAVTVADFNGDGKQDLVVVNGGSGDVSILLGNGDGTFEAAVNYSVGGTASSPISPTFVAVGDFNGDHKLDLAVANGAANTVSILLGNGDGTFQTPIQYPTTVSADYVAAADFNNDQKSDLLVATVGSITILLGNGDGTFQSPQTTTITSFQGTTPDVAIGDFNGDGKLDVATGNATVHCCATTKGNLIILFGNGDGTFQSPVSSPVNFQPTYLTAGDIDGDGKADLAVIGAIYYENQLHLLVRLGLMATLLGDGQGSFSVSALVAFPGNPRCFVCFDENPFASNLAVADLNDDGKPDVVLPLAVPDPSLVSGQPSAIWTFPGNGDGTFQPVEALPLTAVPGWLAVGEFNSDGLPDLVVTNSSANSISILLNTGPPPPPPDFSLSSNPTTKAMAAGGAATFTLSITPANGFNQTVALSCTGAPALATCFVSPASVSPNGTSAATTTVTFTTTAPTMTVPRGGITMPPLGNLPLHGLWLLLPALVLSALALTGRRRKLALVLALATALVWVGCGGGPGPTATHSSGTPVGTYTLTLTGSSGNLSHSTTVTVTVNP